MSLLRDLRKRVPQVGGQAVALLFAAYFTYHALHGDRGLKTWVDLREQVVQAEQEHAALVDERLRLENKVQRLRRPTLDPDLLEEEALKLLNLGHPNDYIVLVDPRQEGGSQQE